jgi:hypothetical protein
LRSDGVEQRARVKLYAPREEVKLEPGGEVVEWAANSILEVAIPVKPKEPFVSLCLSAWKDGLPVDAIPQQGWLTIACDTESSR